MHNIILLMNDAFMRTKAIEENREWYIITQH